MRVVTRVPAILTAIVALAVSAAPVASAGGPKGIVTDNKDPDKLRAVRVPKQGGIVYNGHAGLGANVRAAKVPGRAEWPNLTVRDLDKRYVKAAPPRGSS